jgi:hypothetical protein
LPGLGTCHSAITLWELGVVEGGIVEKSAAPLTGSVVNVYSRPFEA